MLSTQIHSKYNYVGKLKVKECKKKYHGNTNQKKAEVAIIISDEVNFRARKITRAKWGHYIMIINQDIKT